MRQIKNLNDLSASITEMNAEKAKRDAQMQDEQKKIEAEKAEKKRQQELKEQEDRDRLLPECN
jgi:Skp family chaperone for outer membrane proteins